MVRLLTSLVRLNKVVTSCSIISLTAISVTACSPSTPELAGASSSGGSAAGGFAKPLSDSAFESLAVDEQYRVVNKVLGTLYSGVPVDEFYAIEPGSNLQRRLDNAPTLASIRTALQTDLKPDVRLRLDREIIGEDENGNEQEDLEPLFYFDSNRPKQIPLARIHHFPLSSDVFRQWMAWHLANTILFSPAEEIDSADITDVQNLFRRLELSMSQGRSVREMIAVHQRTVENWRRFRSPEDNTREMMEIYLGIFDNDEEVPLASQACQDLYLTDERDGYKLAYTDYPNAEPVSVLGQYITNCNDFYDAVAGHPLLIPRVVSVLVDYFYAADSLEHRTALAASISQSNPQHFEDIFLAILFSEHYLLRTERPRSFEEAFLSTAKRLKWEAHPDLFKGMINGRGSLARTNMGEMGWPSMSLKLGRVANVPLDSLSFGNYHKAMRESLLMSSDRWERPLGLDGPSAPKPYPIEEPASDASERELASYAAKLKAYNEELDAMSPADRAIYDEALAEYYAESVLFNKIDDMTVDELMSYLFLTAIQRRPTELESNELKSMYQKRDYLDIDFNNRFAHSNRIDDLALLTFDYLSRLPEGYYLVRSQ